MQSFANFASLLGWVFLFLGLGAGIIRMIQSPDSPVGRRMIVRGVLFCIGLQVLSVLMRVSVY